jgi:flagellar basal body-associated protein FliL
MNLNHVKRALRGWLPQQPSAIQKLRQHSTPIAVGIIITILSVSAFMVSSNFLSGSAVSVIPVVNNQIPEQNLTEATPSPQETTPPLNVTNLTKEQALAIAEPIIQQYAAENNRVITNLTIQLAKASDDGSRGGLTLQQVLALNLTASEAHNKFSYYPVWVIDATFQWEQPQIVGEYDANGTIIGGHFPADATWIFGYNVAIWADTGEIKSQGSQGMN